MRVRLNAKHCLLCGELRGGNLRVAGYEICAACERGLMRGGATPPAALHRMRRLAVKVCLTMP